MRTGNCSCQANRSMRFLESMAEDQLAVAVMDKILAVPLPSEEDATSLSDSRFKLKELWQSSIGKKCSRGFQAFIYLVDELVANLQAGLGPDSLLDSGMVFHQKRLGPSEVLSTGTAQGSRLEGSKHHWGRLRHCTALKRWNTSSTDSQRRRRIQGRQVARVGGMPSFQEASDVPPVD